ncbi:hypothetical protein C8J56DRAFT_1060247 [Mycena floridula]|nr:hypothetical protein C8J56DRAFT_1060247 [Mycena floridula]
MISGSRPSFSSIVNGHLTTIVETSTFLPGATTLAKQNNSPSSHIAAIAGGTIAGLVLLIIITALTFFFLRARRRRRNGPDHEFRGDFDPVMTTEASMTRMSYILAHKSSSASVLNGARATLPAIRPEDLEDEDLGETSESGARPPLTWGRSSTLRGDSDSGGKLTSSNDHGKATSSNGHGQPPSSSGHGQPLSPTSSDGHGQPMSSNGHTAGRSDSDGHGRSSSWVDHPERWRDSRLAVRNRAGDSPERRLLSSHERIDYIRHGPSPRDSVE